MRLKSDVRRKKHFFSEQVLSGFYLTVECFGTLEQVRLTTLAIWKNFIASSKISKHSTVGQMLDMSRPCTGILYFECKAVLITQTLWALFYWEGSGLVKCYNVHSIVFIVDIADT